MSTKRATKRALLTSILAICLCLVMLVGSTFAWFTDTASTGVNKIVSGNLHVEIQDKEGNPVSTLKWVKEDGSALDQDAILWEPGCRYILEPFKIVNTGNLALKYKLVIAGLDGDSELLKVITFTYTANNEEYDITQEGHLTPAGTDGASSDPITVSAVMDTAAGNEYMDKELKGVTISVYATQYTFESDSYDDQYDKGAEYGEMVGTAADLEAALAEGKDIVLTSDIELTKPLTIKAGTTIYGNGNSVISAQPVYVAADANVEIKNVNFATPTNAKSNASSVYSTNLNGKVVFDGCTFTNPQWECIQITPLDGAEVIVTNCTFIVDGTGTYAKANGTKVERMLHIENTKASGDYKVTVTNNKFIGVDLAYNSVIDIDEIAAFANVTCGGNTFFNHDNTAVTTLADKWIYVNLKGQYSGTGVATDTYAQFTQATPAALHQ